MNKILSNIKYTDLASSNSTLVKYTIPIEGQTYEYILQDGINSRTYNLSNRNGAGAYIVPVNEEKLYLNFIPKKIVVSDNSIKDYVETTFSYFIPAEIIPPDKFSLPEGQLFRCVSSTSLPKSKEAYTYYIIEDGLKRLIPNYLTLEVMLFERNGTLLSVRIIQENECSDIEDGQPMPDKSPSWNDTMEDQTNFEILKGLEDSVKTGQALAESAKAEAGAQVAAVKAQAEASKAEAEAAKAEAEASALAAAAAIAEANAKQAEFEAKLNG